MCLWPPAGIVRREAQPQQTSIVSADCLAPHPAHDADWDAGNLGCGELVMGLRTRLQSMKPGQVLKLTATDAGIPEDLPAWCRLTGHTLISANHPEYLIQRRES
ncbi:MAG: sulfurtransferase TusA family protein [Acidobacteria bacterium]|nr:sulfurtransferase TusA family protein [Acidobacteriota bacterium]